MPATLYALLVGIDDYRAPVPYLRGCVNDIRAFESLLHSQAAHRDMSLEVKVLLNEEATRNAVIDGFVTHLSQADEHDVALFYYSGHGSQERTPPELKELESDGLDETIVCFDSRNPGKYDLADKEIASLIRYVARRNAHVAVILDCCHSGSGTRAVLGDGALVRRAPTFTEVRAVDTFFVAPGDIESAGSPVSATWMKAPGRHLVISACHDDEEAKETVGVVPQRGAFSFYLTEALTNSLGRSTYRDIFNQVSSRVRATTPRQSPVMEAVVNDDMNRPFLGGAIEPHQPYFTIHFEKTRGWVVDGGTVQGIPAVAGNETTVFALFPASANLDPGSQLRGQIGSARVTASYAVSSQVDVSMLAGEPDPTLTYKAVIVGLPMPALGVKMLGTPEALAPVRRELAVCGPENGPSLLVAESSESFRLTLLAQNDHYRIMRAGDDQSLAVDVDDLKESGAQQVVQRLEHMARWIRVLDLQNPSGRLPSGSVVLDVYCIAEDGKETLIGPEEKSATPRLVYTRTGDQYKPARIKVVMRNRSPRRLFCALIDLPGTFGVFSLLPGGTTLVEPGTQVPAIVGGRTEFEAAILDDTIAKGVLQLDETLKVIASTEEWDPTLLEMPDLDLAQMERGGNIRVADTLSRLMSRVQTRRILPVDPGDVPADWTTSELTVTIVRPRDEVAVPEAGDSVQLATGVILMGHAGLEAVARLSPEGIASRDPNLMNPTPPPWLVDHPETVRPYQFPGSRADTPALSVLELRQVGDAGAVSAEAPLIIRTEQPLAADETVLPYAFDGEFYIPLGFAEASDGATQISIVRLPNPNTKTLKGSLSIFFKKVISEHLGTSFPYPLLSAVGKGTSGKATYVTNPDLVARRVSGAQTILLYIHGIIGDTQAMTASAFAPPPDSGAAPRLAGDEYDLILAFDYENLNTPIEQTARDLRQRLVAVGLAPGHNKQLHVVAHSMGGLVARWFIEQEGGNKVVSRLTMLGTPNGGSPWSAYEQWFSTLLSFGLNGLSHIPWPPTVLGSLMRAITWTGKVVTSQHGKIEVALAEMNPKSDFLKLLAASQDPGVPYAMIAGNTSLVRSAYDGKDTSRLARLLEHLSPQDVLYRTTALAFFNTPNDIAVAVDAITNIPETRSLQPSIHEVDCDHVSYFINQSALDCIAGPQRI